MSTTLSPGLTSQRIREANEADGKALAELLFQSPQLGRMVLGQDRFKDYFARGRPYDASVTFVAEGDRGELLSTLSVATKTVLLGGSEVKAAFMFDLAVLRGARRGGYAMRMLREVERWASEQGAAFLYSHILEGNVASIGALRVEGHRVVRRLVSLTYPVPDKSAALSPSAHPIEDWSSSAKLLRTSLEPYNLVRPLGGDELEALWTSLPGYRAEDVWSTGRSILGLWDYSDVSRAIPLQVPLELRALSTVTKLGRSLGLPFFALPELGKPLTYGLVLGGVGDDRELLSLFGAALGRAKERGIGVVVLFHDARLKLPWTRAGFRLKGSYALLLKPLVPDVMERFEARPVWVDTPDL